MIADSNEIVPPSYVLSELEMFNWGGFDGYHSAPINAAGTAVIGPTGSGKTTLVDALMTLLTANPKYNLASTGGHESDRDMVSYVRGVSGPGDGGGGQSHIARNGKTLTAIAATFSNGSTVARLGGLLWFDSSSSSPSDMKKLWIFTTSAEQTMRHWLEVQQEGGMRALRQLDKTETGMWSYPAKKGYLARIRDFFEVRENAFNLLNRAAGLKQLNSIDQIFRELVLDNSAQFSRAKEVADSFDDLAEIHEELEVARRQQHSLEPVKTSWEKYQQNGIHLHQKNLLHTLLPTWFGEQAHQLWQAENQRLSAELQYALGQKMDVEQHHKNQQKKRDELTEVYLKLGGSNIQVLEELIKEKQQNLSRCQTFAHQYQQLLQVLALPEELSRAVFEANKTAAEQRLQETQVTAEDVERKAFECDSLEREGSRALTLLQDELAEIRQRPSSNIPAKFHHFRTELAAELGLAEDDLPFVAELVQVKEGEQSWRSAIERAIGSHRLRVLVPPELTKAALSWVNQRHNHLHVRILEVKQKDTSVNFWEDGFCRKVEYKPHDYRQTVKELLAGIDRHCVATAELLSTTPHAMTAQGSMSGKARFFDKQDQRRLGDDNVTGFDNRDRLAYLSREITTAEQQQQQLSAAVRQARAELAALRQQQAVLGKLQDLEFEQVDVEFAGQELEQQQHRLGLLTAPDSDVAAAKKSLEALEQQLETLDQTRVEWIEKCTQIQKDQQRAEQQQARAFKKSEIGLSDEHRQLSQDNFIKVKSEQINDLVEIEQAESRKLLLELDQLKEKKTRLAQELTRKMSDAQREDRGALAEVGRELEDVPHYLQRLKTLVEEALPEKRQRFKEYLNRSSDEGVTQLLMTIDSEVEKIEEKLDDVNSTLQRVDFQAGRYLQLVCNKIVHQSLRNFSQAQAKLTSARYIEDEGESQYKALQVIVGLLRDACERQRTDPAKALLDPRFRLGFMVSVIERGSGTVIETRSGSQGGSGGEKEIIASYVLTASLSYALCPDGSSRPLFGSIVLDEAFSRSSHAVAGRIIAALTVFGLHALFITPNKEMRLLRNHTRSAIVVHRRGMASTLTTLSWQELDVLHQQRSAEEK